MAKVAELTPAEKQEARRFVDRLVERNGNIVGSGHFSCVYEHPSRKDVVVKVSTQANDGGVLYAFWARAHQDLLGVPQILDVFQSDELFGFGEERTTTVITMKRYDCVVGEAKDFMVNGTGLIAKTLQRSLDDTLYSTIEEEGGSEPVGNTPITQAYIDTARTIGEFFAGVSTFDLHDENVMLDLETGELVIIDPLSFNKDPDITSAVMTRIQGATNDV